MLPVAILAGGLATRLRPLTETIPKSLVEINGEPFLWHQLRLLRASGIESRRPLPRLSRRDGARIGRRRRRLRSPHRIFLRRRPVLLGTAGALKRALPLLGDSFFVLYGDSYLPCD